PLRPGGSTGGALLRPWPRAPGRSCSAPSGLSTPVRQEPPILRLRDPSSSVFQVVGQFPKEVRPISRVPQGSVAVPAEKPPDASPAGAGAVATRMVVVYVEVPPPRFGLSTDATLGLSEQHARFLPGQTVLPDCPGVLTTEPLGERFGGAGLH